MIEYTWLIPFVPMLCFVLIGIFGQKTPQKGGYIAIAGAAFSFILSAVIAYEYLTGTTYPEPVTDSIRWFAIGDVQPAKEPLVYARVEKDKVEKY